MGGGSPSSTPPPSAPAPVSLLILGAGWTSTFLIPLLTSTHPSITYAATTRSGHNHTIPFTFTPTHPPDLTPYRSLPRASSILIVFPLLGASQTQLLISNYRAVHGSSNHFIQLGSTGIWNSATGWVDRSTEYKGGGDPERASAEEELVGKFGGTVLDLAGLYGGERHPKHWIERVARSKEVVRGKGSVHLVHGRDVARGVVGCLGCDGGKGVRGRWLVTDTRVYDWWDLIQMWGPEVREGRRRREGGKGGQEGERGKEGGIGEGEETEGPMYERWVGELMIEEGVRALPRGVERLGRMLDSRAFWEAIGVWPQEGRAC